MEATAARLSIYTVDLSDFSDRFTAASLSAARRTFKFFPSIAELSKFLENWKEPGPHYERKTDFRPSYALEKDFNDLKETIGASAYRSWFRGGESWVDAGGDIIITVGSAAKADWIRRNYAEILSSGTGRAVHVRLAD